MSTPLLSLRGVTFGYGTRPVVSGIDMQIASGDMVGIIGPNGSGKTTLFRGILGLIPPLAGSVERFTRRLGYVPQREQLDPIYPLTVEEVVHMGCYGRLSGLRRLRAEERALTRQCLERVGLLERGKDLFSALSGGQRQRVLIARALMTRPQLLLLDEPTSGVDQASQESILQVLRELGREGLAVLLVSHQLELVRQAVNEVLWVAHGRVASGPVEEILRKQALDQLFLGTGGAQA